jgi:hypothetical protein
MSDTKPAFVELYRPGSHADLALLRAALDDAGIRYFVKNEFATIGARAAIGADELSLMVAAADAVEARQLISEILRARARR